VRSVPLADVLLVAAAATGRPVEELLDGVDLTVLVLVTGRARAAETVAESAAELLVGVAASRPFPAGNRAAAWALAAHVATLNRRRFELASDEVVALLDEIAAGRLDEAGAAVVLDPALAATPGRVRRAFAAAWAVPPPPPAVEWACPECGRAVAEAPYRSSAFLSKPLPDDVVRDCSVRHRRHGPTSSQQSLVLDPHRRTVALRRA